MTTDELTTARLDVPVADLEPRSILAAATSRTLSPSDQLAYRLDVELLAHPELCSTPATYPWWTPAMGCCPTHATGGAR